MPLIITNIIETQKIEYFLTKRRLFKQYQKAKEYIIGWDFDAVQFKLRKPKSDRFFYFRINKQYRAWCLLEWKTLKVFKIDNHQK